MMLQGWEDLESRALLFAKLQPFSSVKGDLISEDILTLPTKGAKSCPRTENLNKLFTEKDGKFEISAQGPDFAPFVGKVTKVKIPIEKKPPLKLPLNVNIVK